MSREKLAENLLTFVPFMYKRLMKGFPSSEISRQQLGLLFHVSKDDGRPMSYYSEKIMVPKPNLTVMADKLIEEGLIERAFDPNDRRIVILKITGSGSKFLNAYKGKVRQEMVKRLGYLKDDDISRLNELIEEMKTIFDKIEK